jgi:Tol biopolymer transport system component
MYGIEHERHDLPRAYDKQAGTLNSRFLGSVAIALGGMLAGLALAYALSTPRVELVAPGAVDASTSAVIELHFNRPVQANSVEERFAVEPPVDGTFEWPDEQTARFSPTEPLNADTDYAVRLAPGVRTSRGVVSPLGTRFAFQTGHPTLLYLAVGDDGTVGLWRVEPDGSDPRELVELAPEQSVHSFDASPDGSQIVLSLEREDGGADLALLPRSGGQPELLRECPGSACILPVWSPDGTRIAYEQRALVISDIGPSLLTGQVWVLDIDTGEAEPVVAREVQGGTGPGWSPDGGRLAFHDGGLDAIVIFDFAAERFSEERVRLVPNLAGERVVWAPDGESIAFAELFLSEEDAASLSDHADEHDPNQPHVEPTPGAVYLHLVQYAVETETLRDLSGELVVEDGTPAFSPDGRWLAFGRRTLEGQSSTVGRQLWLYDLQNEEHVRLLDEPTYNHGAYRWSPDGQSIAYMRFNTLDPRAQANVWVVEVPGGEADPVVEGAFLPAWLP